MPLRALLLVALALQPLLVLVCDVMRCCAPAPAACCSTAVECCAQACGGCCDQPEAARRPEPARHRACCLPPPVDGTAAWRGCCDCSLCGLLGQIFSLDWYRSHETRFEPPPPQTVVWEVRPWPDSPRLVSRPMPTAPLRSAGVAGDRLPLLCRWTI